MGINNVISLLGGVALFLFGMTLMGDGLKKERHVKYLCDTIHIRQPESGCANTGKRRSRVKG